MNRDLQLVWEKERVLKCTDVMGFDVESCVEVSDDVGWGVFAESARKEQTLEGFSLSQ